MRPGRFTSGSRTSHRYFPRASFDIDRADRGMVDDGDNDENTKSKTPRLPFP
jgi:hypothetical protein